LRRWQRAPAPHDLPFLVHVHRTGVDPARPGVSGGVQLPSQLVGRPEVVVVAEGDPGAARGGDAPVTRRADTLGRVVPQHPDTVVVHGRDDCLHLARRGAVVDDDDLEIDGVLQPDRAERLAEEPLPVTRRDDDADRDHEATLAREIQ
jgi:hypothetical protein